MRNLILYLSLIALVFGGFEQTLALRSADGEKLVGERVMSVRIYSERTGSEIVWSSEGVRLRFDNGFLANLDDILPESIKDGGEYWVEILDSGRGLSDGRLRYTSTPLRREAPSEPGEDTETMATHLQIGRVGETDDLVVHSPRTGFGIDTPNERIDVDGAIGLKEGAAPPATTDFGKVYVNDSDGHLYYIDDLGNVTDLTVDANAVQSVSSSANPTGRTEHMRFIPGSSTEITESATDDTIYISYNVNVTSDPVTPCSDEPDAPAGIEGPTTVCEMAEGVAYAVPPVSGATYYYWTLPVESYLASGAGSNSVVVNFGSTDGDIVVNSYNDCGISLTGATTTITMNHPPLMPGTITGTSSVCEGATQAYSITPVSGASTYTWSLPSGAFIASGYGTNSVTITFASSSGTVCVTADNSCGSSEPQCLPVTVFGSLSGVVPGAITGASSVCSGATDVSYSISEMSDATSYSWTVPGDASIVSGSGTNSILVDFGTSSGNVSVTASNSCGSSDSRSLSVSVSPNSVGGSISGASSICLGTDTGTMTLSGNVGSVTKWQKSHDGGGWMDISRTEITYSETPSLSGAWEYRAEVRSGACAAVYSASHTVNVAPNTVGGTVSGGTSPICIGSGTGTLTLSGHTGSIVRWQRQLDGGSWTDIGHTSSTYSETPSSAGTWQYRAVVQSSPCLQENSVPVAIEVSEATVAGAITGGSSPICLGSSTGTLTLSGHTGDVIKWQRSTNGGSTWTDITHTAATYSETPPSTGTYVYRAVVQSGVCSVLNSATSISITVNDVPATPTAINGPASSCQGLTGVSYWIDPVAFATGYTWTLPSGSSIATGSGTDSITVNFGSTSGNICVSADNSCGSSTPECLSVTLGTTPTGSASFSNTSTGRTGTIQSWTVPSCVYSIDIEAWGAQGGTASGTGGRGARMKGTFDVEPGQVLKIIVGQQGLGNGSNASGGGGSFVWDNGTSTLMIAAAGGGGGISNSTNPGGAGSSTATTTSGYGSGSGAGGTGGNGGAGGNRLSGTYGTGGGGCGWFSNGDNGTADPAGGGGARPLAGGYGGVAGSGGVEGGFGGGGGSSHNSGTGGGGGGYNGGGGGNSWNGSTWGSGGGAGSYNSGTAQSNSSAVRTGHGQVTITY